MSRTEKIVAFLLGALVFAGLFIFIFTALRTPPAAPPLGDVAFDGGDEDPFDFDVAASTETMAGVFSDDREPTTVAPAKPAPVNTGKK